jgi:hypothetical protein
MCVTLSSYRATWCVAVMYLLLHFHHLAFTNCDLIYICHQLFALQTLLTLVNNSFSIEPVISNVELFSTSVRLGVFPFPLTSPVFLELKVLLKKDVLIFQQSYIV